jgi:transposase
VVRQSDVEEFLDPDEEQVLDRVCAIDVAKDSGMVCTRLPHPSRAGRRASRTWQVTATKNAVTALAQELVQLAIEKVTLESTSDYWRIWFYVLEQHGLDVQLVNARDVKNVPGRPKTDKLDAVWLAKLTEKGLLRASFVPPPQIRTLRDYTRTRIDLTRERTRHWQRLEKLLEDALVKVSSVVSTLGTKSARDMIEALIAGEQDAGTLAALARGRMKGKNAALIEALNGDFDAHHAEIARVFLDQIDALTRVIDQLTVRIDELITAIPEAQTPTDPPGTGTGTGEPGTGEPGRSTPSTALPALQRLAEIPGISLLAAQTIVAEIGFDMTRFLTAEHLSSWAKLTPVTRQSGTKTRTGKTGKGNPYLKGILGIAATAASRTDTFLGERYRRIIKRRGKLKAIVATARSILVTIWHLLNNPADRYRDLGPDYHTQHIDTARKTNAALRQLKALGYHVTLTTTQPEAA